MSRNGPLIDDGVDRDTGLPLPDYQYLISPLVREPAIYGGRGSQEVTQTDVLDYYWTQDCALFARFDQSDHP